MLSAQGTEDAIVSGVVVSSTTDRPVVRAGVIARPIGQARQSASVPASVDGRFSIRLPAGSYRFDISAPGYERQSIPALSLTPGGRTTDLVVRLTPLTGLTGVVVAGDGKVISGALVELLDPVAATSGRRTLRQLPTTFTNERGEYHIRNVPAGRYLVRASAEIKGRTAYQSTFHPGVPLLKEARPVEIAPGADAQANFMLPAVQPVRLRLLVEGEGDEWAQFMAVSADAPFSRPEPLLLNRVESGHYVAMIAPGAWRIAVRFRNKDVEFRAVRTTVVAGEEHELSFRPRPGIDLDGTMTVQEGSVPVANATVSLEPADDQPYDGPALSAQTDRAGRFRLPGIPAGEWTLSVERLPESAFVSSLQLSGRAADPVLAIDAQTRSPLRIILSQRGARIRGTVAMQAGAVMLLPSSNALARCQVVPVSADGRFVFTGLAPDEYGAYVVESPRLDACDDPSEVLLPDQRAVPVKVQEGDDLELKLSGAP